MANAGFDKQAQRMLGKRRRNRRWIPVAACLVLVVAVGTFYFMMQQGQAMSWRDMVLDCQASVHSHTTDCYNDEGVLTCGYANYLVHEHTDDCYDNDGHLVCGLPEVKEHHHDEECYEKVEVISCGLEETPAHEHSDFCYDTTLICGQEESAGHTHTDACYDEEGNLACGQEESEGHTHTDACYDRVLTCVLETGEGGHTHTSECVTTELVLTCQKPEVSLHVHTDECYAFIDENGEIITNEEQILLLTNRLENADEEDEEDLPLRALVCGMLQTEKHEHGNECFTKVTKEEPDSETEAESSQLESSGLESSELESGPADSELESDAESSQLEDEPEDNTQPEEPVVGEVAAYEDATLKVTAEFAEELPEGVHLQVERLEEPSQLAEKQAKLKRTMDDEEYSLHALLQIGLRNEDGEAVEFDGPATLTAEFFGEGAGAEGAQICAVAYRQAEENPDLETVPGMVLDLEHAEELPVTLGDNGGAVTEIDGETLLGFGSRAPVKVNAEDVEEAPESEEDNVLHLDQSFSYNTESMFELVFHVRGDAVLADTDSFAVPAATVEPSAVPAIPWGEEDEDEASAIEDDGPAIAGMSDITGDWEPEESEVEPESEAEEDAEEPENEEETTSEEPKKLPTKKLGGVTVSTGTVLPANTEVLLDQPLEFVVEQVQEEDPAYQAYKDYVNVDETASDTDLKPLDVVAYSVHYAGQKLDLSGCEVTVDVKATSQLEEILEEISGTSEEDVKVMLSLLTTADNIVEEQASVLYGDAESYEAAQSAAESAAAMQDAATVGYGSTDNGIGVVTTVAMNEVLADSTTETLIESQRVKAAANSVMAASLEDESGSDDDSASDNTDDSDENDDTSSQGGPKEVSDTIALATNGQLNPHFFVDYYAYLDVVKQYTDGQGDLSVIDTSGGNLPENGEDATTSMATTGLKVVNNQVETETKFRELYTSMECDFFERPTLNYFDALVGIGGSNANSNYELKQIWVLKADETDEGEDDATGAAWVKFGEQISRGKQSGVTLEKLYSVNNIFFSNKVSTEEGVDEVVKGSGVYGFEENGNFYICLANDTQLRLVYDTTTSTDKYPATFYDYDITEKQSNSYVTAGGKGINDSSNYSGSGAKYAFGNANTGTGLDLQSFDGALLNMDNSTAKSSTNPGYKGCTFGIASGITFLEDNSVELNFASKISGPDLFSSTNITGAKTVYPESGLYFTRDGDKYTLSVAETQNKTLSNLETLGHPQAKYPSIWTNNFWPMDGVTNTDPHTGGSQTINRTGGTFPPSDDGLAHNNYFGMHFSIDFNFVGAYRGPLEYLFFGDDDMWVFLTEIDADGKVKADTTQLICDIGGVHSSVGEYVNLWDYIKKVELAEDGSNAEELKETKYYRLDFFYTERGASGSTCWMQFTLPSVGGNETIQMSDYGTLRIEKEVQHTTKKSGVDQDENTDIEDDTTFIFYLRMTDADNKALTYDLRYRRYDAQGKDITGQIATDDDTANIPEGYLGRLSLNADDSGGGCVFTLRSGESIVIENIPFGAKYTVWEDKESVVKTITSSEDPDTKTITANIVKEPPPNDYFTTAGILFNNEGDLQEYTQEGVSGTITEENDKDKIYLTNDGKTAIPDKLNEIQTVKFVNTVYAYELPKTGGSGARGYLWAGAVVCMVGLALIYKKTRRRGKEVVQKN